MKTKHLFASSQSLRPSFSPAQRDVFRCLLFLGCGSLARALFLCLPDLIVLSEALRYSVMQPLVRSPARELVYYFAILVDEEFGNLLDL